MRTVRFGGHRFLLVDRTGDVCVLARPATGERVAVPAGGVEDLPEEPPLGTVGRAADPAAELREAVPGIRALGLLAELERRGPTPVRALLEYELCEADLQGVLAEMSAAGLVAEVTVGGERGYRLTDRAARLL